MKNKILSVSFILLITAVMIVNILIPDKEISISERRTLAKFPEITVDSVFSGKAWSDFDKYTLDQFVLRDKMRSVKAAFQTGIMLRLDSNDVFIKDGHISKLEYPLNEKSVAKAADKFLTLQEKYLQNANAVYYSIIPDKNYYITEGSIYPHIDYEKMESLLNEGIGDAMTYIPIFDCLDADDFYKTDSHWKQEDLEAVTRRIGEIMGHNTNFFDTDYESASYDSFYGVYFSQAALPYAPDTITYLKNEHTENAVVVNVEKNKTTTGVYDLEKLDSKDPYEVFLQGAAALLEITNENAATDKSLMIFRDSYGSSITPLFCGEYKHITVVDIRYVVSDLLGQFVDFDNCDVLFIYCTSVLNSSDILR